MYTTKAERLLEVIEATAERHGSVAASALKTFRGKRHRMKGFGEDKVGARRATVVKKQASSHSLRIAALRQTERSPVGIVR